MISGDWEHGRRCYETSLELYRSLGDDRGTGILLERLAIDHVRRGNHETARGLCEQGLALLRRAGFPKGEVMGLNVLAELEVHDGRLDAAEALYARSAEMAARTGFVWWQCASLVDLAQVRLDAGHLDDAEVALRQALPLLLEMGDRQNLVYALALLAHAAALRGRAADAGRLWGALEEEAVRGPLGLWDSDRESYLRSLAPVAGADFDAGVSVGRTLSLGEAAERALVAWSHPPRDEQ